jgi:predicted transcriptional regulator
VGAIGRVSVAAVDRAAPSEIWRRFGTRTGVDRAAFDAYFAGGDEGVAITVENHRACTPIPLDVMRQRLPGFVVPQSYRYLAADELAHLCGSAEAV